MKIINKLIKVDNFLFDILNDMGNWSIQTNNYGNRYAYMKPKDGKVFMHRFILELMGSNLTNLQVDHIDGNSLNNQLYNLRICTLHKNRFNTKKQNNNTSGYKGVSKINSKRNPYCARIQYKSKFIYLGIYKTAELAAKAYDKKALELFGIYSNLNFK